MKANDRQRVLIIEDDPHIAEGLKLNLEMQGYTVIISGDGVSGLASWKHWQPHLIVLDIMLPGIDGLSVLQSIRLEDERLPILILSARATVDDKVKGLSYGVDDYLSKPFNLEEFMLRVERLLKRAYWEKQMPPSGIAELPDIPDQLTFGENRIDMQTGMAQCQTGSVQLTEQELKLLKLFVRHRGKPLRRSKILEIGWGYTGGMTTRTVDNFIVRFRKYFENDPKNPEFFKSIRGVGYVFDNR
ncbi:MAG: response regulator transcription factor [Pseudomonadota bacterium]